MLHYQNSVVYLYKPMGNLTLFEQEILKVLEMIEYRCESTEILDSETKSLEIFYTDKNRPPLEEELTKMVVIEKYLKKNGINFKLTHNFIDEPERSDGFIMLGIIKDENIKNIKSKVLKLISELKIKDNKKKLTLNKAGSNQEIKQLELLEDKTTNKGVTVYINVKYDTPRKFRRGKNWGKMYELAMDQRVPYNKTFFDYFNSNNTNPLYTKEGFKVTKILNKEYDYITPKIEIRIITQKAVTQRLKSA